MKNKRLLSPILILLFALFQLALAKQSIAATQPTGQDLLNKQTALNQQLQQYTGTTLDNTAAPGSTPQATKPTASINSPQAKSITITNPKSGQKFQPGQVVPITWTSQGISNVIIIWTRTDAYQAVLATGWISHPELSSLSGHQISNTGSFSWTIPSNMTTGTYLVQVFNYDPNASSPGGTYAVDPVANSPNFIIQTPGTPIPPSNPPVIKLSLNPVFSNPANGVITQGQIICFSVGIKNTGTASAPSISAHWLIDGMVQKAGSIVWLPADNAFHWGDTTGQMTDYCSASLSTGVHLIRFEASYDPTTSTSTQMYITVKPAGTEPIIPDIKNGGFVSINFDDGNISAYKLAIPILNAAGFKSTDYIISKQIQPDFSGYVSKSDIQELAREGHEIGNHTQTHPHLLTLTNPQLNNEVQGAQQDFLNMGVSIPTSFAYPYGEFNAQTEATIKGMGFASARSTQTGLNFKSTDPYALTSRSLQNTDTFADIKKDIDNAVKMKGWYIMAVHQIDTSDQYSISHALFQQIVDYLKQNNIPVATNSQGLHQFMGK